MKGYEWIERIWKDIKRYEGIWMDRKDIRNMEEYEFIERINEYERIWI